KPVLISGTDGRAEGILAEARNSRQEIQWEPDLCRRLHPLMDVSALAGLVKRIRAEKPDIVHTHTSKAGFLGRLAARIAGVPGVLHTPHGHIYASRSNIRGVPDRGPLKNLLLASERFVGRWTDVLTTLSEAERRESIELGLSTKANTRVVHNGVPKDFAAGCERQEVRREFGVSDSAPVVISVGRLSPVKGHKYFVEAASRVLKKVPEAHFWLVGDGPERDTILRQARQLQLGENFVLTGRRDDVPALLSAADISVVPSLYEGFGLVAVEAMAAGLPVVGSRVGGLAEVISDGKTGLLVEPKSSAHLAQAIIKLLSSKELRKQFGQAGRQRHLRCFTLERMIQKFETVYEECLNRNGKRG
ncbi:MAG: glycosyltransferase family 4 protein, partial [Planctomycetes bacterium]|nr:glycosyltransferase family 4 protein [Planctomycetota bacterium]